MKILYYDCFAGISGDMNLAAMIGLGVEKEYLLAEISKLNLPGYTLNITREERSGISGTRVDVVPDLQDDQHHRHLSDIEKIIDESGLAGPIKSTSKKIFRRLAEAEAKVHSTSPGKIHFHEVGAIDSIVDIVGAAICYHRIGADRVLCSTIELGGGFVTCSHGKLPVPAPATVEILQGIPVRKGTAGFETTTPTGAAILATLVDRFTDQVGFSIDRTAYGIGHKKSDELPNVLRVFLGSSIPGGETEATEIMVECTIDDMNPEVYDFLMEKLFNSGAREVFFTPVIMKKSRPGVKVSVLCSAEDVAPIRGIIFRNTTTLGLRYYPVHKSALEREFTTLDTDLGKVTVKTSYFEGRLLHRKPEYEDCRIIALEKNLPVKEVYDRILAILAEKDQSG